MLCVLFDYYNAVRAVAARSRASILSKAGPRSAAARSRRGQTVARRGVNRHAAAAEIRRAARARTEVRGAEAARILPRTALDVRDVPAGAEPFVAAGLHVRAAVSLPA